jgi:hypothetical protein
MTMQRIIMPPVLEFLPYPAADLKVQVGRYRDGTGIEQAVNVTPQPQAIARLMPAAVAVGTDVGGFQRGEGSFLRHHAAAPKRAGKRRRIADQPGNGERLCMGWEGVGARKGTGHAFESCRARHCGIRYLYQMPPITRCKPSSCIRRIARLT